MSSTIEIYGAVHDQPSKGHDRLLIDKENSFVGVFDGAGGDELSEQIFLELPRIIVQSLENCNTSQEQFLTQVMTAADNQPQGYLRKATAAVACARLLGSQFQIQYANFGDSSLYLYDHQTDILGRIGHTETTYYQEWGQTFTDIGDFLGNFRTQEEIRRSTKEILLPADSEWSLMGFSDGVQDDDGRGIKTSSLKEIVCALPASEVPVAVLGEVDAYDDASIFIMSHRSKKLRP